MLIAPVPARRRVPASRSHTGQISLFEIDEAFAVVTEKFVLR
jgi:hypothetical protein